METIEIPVGGMTRRFIVHLPQSARGEMPLVLVLHGNHPDACGAQMREWTGFDKRADSWGFAVAYPDGYGGCWADGRGVTTAEEAGVDDVGFLRAIIDWAAERHGTYPDRAIVAGISNGAFMSHRMALESSDRVAVFAAVAGGLPAGLRDSWPTHAVSAMLIHGTADKMSPIKGGFSRHRGPNGELRGRTLSLQETAERWRAIDRCEPAPGTHTTESSKRDTWRGGVGGTRVVEWTVFDGGHTWTIGDFDVAEEICRFAHPLLAPAGARQL